MMTRVTIPAVLAAALTAAVALTGCTDSFGKRPSPETVSTSDMAAPAEGYLLDMTDLDFEVDCGDEIVAFEVGTVVDCTGTSDELDEPMPLLVEIAFIDGTFFDVTAKSNWPAGPSSPAEP